MPSIVANLKVKEDEIEEAKGFLKQLAADTLAKEPGTLVYTVHQRKDDPTAFVFYEKYESDDAFKTHGANLAKHGAKFGAVLAGAPDIIFLEEV